MPFDDLPGLVGAELGVHDGLAALEQCLEHRPLRATVDERWDGEAHQLSAVGAGLREVPLIGDGIAGVPVDAAAEDPEYVFLAPHDALRIPGRAAGVEHVHVVVRPRLEVAFGASVGDRLLVRQPVDSRGVEVAAVLHHDRPTVNFGAFGNTFATLPTYWRSTMSAIMSESVKMCSSSLST